MENALQIVGREQTGRLEDPKDIAQRIIDKENAASALTITPSSLITMQMLIDSPVSEPLLGSNAENTALELLGLAFPPSSSRTEQEVSEFISHRSVYGRTVLHTSVTLDYPRLIRQLIDLGIDLDLRDTSGHTALHYASMLGNAECLEILVRSGANTAIVDSCGHVAQEIASTRGHAPIAAFLMRLKNAAAESSDGHSTDDPTSDSEVFSVFEFESPNTGMLPTDDPPVVQPAKPTGPELLADAGTPEGSLRGTDNTSMLTSDCSSPRRDNSDSALASSRTQLPSCGRSHLNGQKLRGIVDGGVIASGVQRSVRACLTCR